MNVCMHIDIYVEPFVTLTKSTNTWLFNISNMVQVNHDLEVFNELPLLEKFIYVIKDKSGKT